MLISGVELVSDLEDPIRELTLPGWLTHEFIATPHKQPHLGSGHGAVYAFALSSAGTSLSLAPPSCSRLNGQARTAIQSSTRTTATGGYSRSPDRIRTGSTAWSI